MPPPFSLTYYDPPPALARHVMVLFAFSTDLPYIEDLQPGGLGQFVLFPRGHGETILKGEVSKFAAKGHLLSGFSVAAPFTIQGPWDAIGASLSPLGWAALTGAPASEYVDRFVPVGDLLGPEATAFCENLSERYCDGALSGEETCEAIAEWLEPRMGTVPARHEHLMEVTIAWLGSSLNPDLDALFEALDYSRRQAERLVERYFGLPPAALARKFRALRAAALLAQDKLSDTDEAALADAFYDQPHMVHEIRRFCGYTPSRLGGDGQPILKTLLQLKNYTRLQEFRAS